MKSTTVLTNLQRGNIEAKIKTKIELTFFERCAQGEISEDDIISRDDINEEDENKFTALHWAAFYGQLKTTGLLLDHGANPNALAKNYVTPLHLAASSGHHEVVKVLLTKGADASRMDINGNTPLHFASANNHPHSTNEILNFADVMLTNEDSKTAYHLAIEKKAFLSQTVIENFIGNLIKN